MEELMEAIQEKTGLPADKAQGAAEAALDFLKEKLPGGLGEKIESYLAGNAESIADMASGLGDQAKKLFGRWTGHHRIEYG